MLITPFFTENHNIFRESVRNFATKELWPKREEWEAKGIFDRWVFNRAGELGLFGINVPEEYGGSNLDYWYTVAYAEELPRCGMGGVPMALMVQSDMAGPHLLHFGTHDQKKEFLAPAVRGEKILALGVTEPNAGSDVAGMQTKAIKDGDHYIINGAKLYITNGTRADYIMLAAKTNPDAKPGYAGVSMFIFPTDTPGFSVSRKLKKLGNLSSDTAELSFQDCRIHKDLLLGEENAGFYSIMRCFQGERLIACISSTAGAQYTLDRTIEFVKSRKAFGKPVSKFQVTQHKLVDLQAEIEACRQFTYRCCEAHNAGENVVKEISMAKLLVGYMGMKVVNECLQLHGGAGYMEEYDVSRAYRDVRLFSIGGGTNEVMKEIIAKMMGL